MHELDALLQAADAADAVLKRYFRKTFSVEEKPDGSKATTADFESQKAVLAVLKRRFPEYGVLAEESGTAGNPARRFVIDPLDGTHSFIRGSPFCGPLLAYEKDGEVLAGVVSLPLLGQRVWAAKGKGCFWNGEPCRVSVTGRLQDAFLNFEWAGGIAEGFGDALPKLACGVHLARGYADLYGYFAVATGMADGFIEGYHQAWDVAAPRICIQEAGGKMARLAGRKNGLSVATNRALHETVCGFLEKRRV